MNETRQEIILRTQFIIEEECGLTIPQSPEDAYDFVMQHNITHEELGGVDKIIHRFRIDGKEYYLDFEGEMLARYKEWKRALPNSEKSSNGKIKALNVKKTDVKICGDYSHHYLYQVECVNEIGEHVFARDIGLCFYPEWDSPDKKGEKEFTRVCECVENQLDGKLTNKLELIKLWKNEWRRNKEGR